MNTRIEACFRHTQGAFTLHAELNVPARGITGLYGPSGSGKTTLLRCMAGLERAEDGFLCMGGDIWQDKTRFLSAHQRPIGMVFQDVRLFPHKNVRDNLRYSCKRRSSGHTDMNLETITELLHIGDFLDRRPASLSGGEAQRIAIGRALMASPKLLLMDEPLAAVDAGHRNEFMFFLKRLHHSMNIPVMMVSHHMRELVQISDHLALIDQGKIQACGPIGEVLSLPDLPETHAVESGAVLDSTIHEFDANYDLTRLHSEAGTLFVPGRIGANGDNIRLRIHARDISLALTPPHDSSILNILSAMITAIGSSGGPQLDVRMEANGIPLLARLTRKSADQLGLIPGKTVYALIKSIAIED